MPYRYYRRIIERKPIMEDLEKNICDKHKFSINDLESWHADLVVTHKCGCKCNFCIDRFVDSSDALTNLSDIEDYLRFLAENEKKVHPEMSSVLILGGEPTKVPFDYLKKVADLIHYYGFNVAMTTNGQSEEKLLELDGYIDFINVSHYGSKAIIDKDYLYKFKKTEITLSKLITKEAFPTFESFKDFIKEAKTNSLNYRFSTLQENTPNLSDLHPKWVDEELLPNCKIVPCLECLNATEYEGYIIKIMHYHNKDKDIDFPPYPKLYPNGNSNRDFSHENPTIEYKRDYSKDELDYSEKIFKYLDYSTRNHWLERSYTNYKSGIPNPIYSTVLAENDSMVLMSINKCFIPGTVSIASKKFHLSPLQYDEKERQDFFEMLNRVSAFLKEKFGFSPLVSEHAANHYEYIKKELSKFMEIVPDSNKEEVFNSLVDAWANIIKGDSGIHSHTLLIPHKLSQENIDKSIQEMGLHKIDGYDDFFKQDINKKYDYFIDNDGNFYFGNDDNGTYYYKKVTVRHSVAEENGIPYLPSKPKKNLEIYYPIIEETLKLFADFDYKNYEGEIEDGKKRYTRKWGN